MIDSSDKFEVFNQTIHSEDAFDDMGVQRKPQRSRMELIENHPGKGAPGRSTQSQIPPPPAKSPPPAPHQPPHQSQPVRPEPVDLKREGSRKGKTWLMLENPIRPGKKRLNELRSSKRSAIHHNEVWRGRTLSLLSHKPGFWYPCKVGSP